MRQGPELSVPPGTQPLPEPLQSQVQGGHSVPGVQSGQAQAQPEPPLESSAWHTPERQVVPASQGIPMAYQAHLFAVSATQVASST
jgi:hypothetical protein